MSTILNTVLNGKSIWFLPVQYGVVSIVEVSLFFSFALSLGACKNLKNKIKKKKVLDKTNSFVIYSFSLAAMLKRNAVEQTGL